MSSARQSPRDGSRASTSSMPRQRRACSPSSPPRTPASSTRVPGIPQSCSADRRSSTITRPLRVVVAETFEQARAAAQLVRVDYVVGAGRVRSRRVVGCGEARRRDGWPCRYGGRRFRCRLCCCAGPARCALQHARRSPRDDGAARLDRSMAGRQAHAVDLQPDDRLEHRRHRQDARHTQGERTRRFRRSSVAASAASCSRAPTLCSPPLARAPPGGR